MEEKSLLTLLNAVAAGSITPATAVERLRALPYEAVGDDSRPFARIDHHRALRLGIQEVIYSPGKEPFQLAAIAREMVSRSGRLLATRATREHYEAVAAIVPEAQYDPAARTITYSEEEQTAKGHVALVSAGTADLPVAEEARVVASWLGSRVDPLYDVGVAGMHRLLDHSETLRAAWVVIAIAGMDGVLPSVVGGLIDRPVIAVPTSTGYGANLQGLAPLLTMLNACPPGIGVVNIDNGFGAACLAHRINMLGVRSQESEARKE